VCVRSFDDELELWDRSADRLVARRSVTGLAQLVALPSGCVGRGVDEIWLLGRGGDAHKLAVNGHPTALGAGAGRVLVATGADVLVFDEAGQQTARHDAGAGIQALSWHTASGAAADGRDWLIVGYRNGNIELRAVGRPPTSSGGTAAEARARLMLEQTPSSEPVRLLAGPLGTLIVGYANGVVGLWHLADGTRLAHSRLHGPVVHLVLEGHQLYAASELGGSLVWGLDAFYLEPCELLRRVWQRVPVLWRAGRAEPAPVPRDHRCYREP
jgi:hypothetical protein